MKKKTLYNPSEKDIVNYRISEIEFDQNGNVMLNQEKKPKQTGRTLEWSLKAGETKAFPVYVADYLKGIYEFLEEKENEPEEEKEEAVPVAKPKEGEVVCKHCGLLFKGMRGLGLHISQKHKEVLL